MLGSMLVLVFVVTAVAIIHFVPSIIAAHRNHQNKIGIFILNLLLGWTVIGWVAALIWALTGQPQRALTL